MVGMHLNLFHVPCRKNIAIIEDAFCMLTIFLHLSILLGASNRGGILYCILVFLTVL